MMSCNETDSGGSQEWLSQQSRVFLPILVIPGASYQVLAKCHILFVFSFAVA